MAIGTYSIGEVAIGEFSGGPVTIDVPVAAISDSINIPTPEVGMLIDVPTMVMGLSALPPQILESANILIPTAALSFTINAPAVGGGTIVEAGGVHTDLHYAGGPGDASVGEFSIGEGPEVTFTYTKPSTMGMRISAPVDIQAGKIQDIPTLAISLAAAIPEIESRRRKLKMLTIPC